MGQQGDHHLAIECKAYARAKDLEVGGCHQVLQTNCSFVFETLHAAKTCSPAYGAIVDNWKNHR